ncbi:hypothetical protein GOV08_04385 [Candidatus Woesearchaeota archaeon]|nr:hypothetical protein [Candidatus Woesearchaeota archaeon]
MNYKKTVYGDKKGKLLIIFSHWKSKPIGYYYLAKNLSSNYHVVLYTYSNEILTSDTTETLKNFRRVVSDANDLINSKKFSSIDVAGFSLGTFLLFMLAKKSKNISKLVAVSSSPTFAEAVWSAWSTRTIKKELVEKKIYLEELKERWGELAPASRLNRLKGKVVLVLSQNDYSIPYPLGENLMINLEVHKKDYEVKVFRYPTHMMLIGLFLTKPSKLLEILEKD